MDSLDGHVAKQGAGEPKSGEGGERRMIGDDPAMILAEPVGNRQDDGNEAANVQQTDGYTE